jgi:transcriptional regulator
MYIPKINVATDREETIAFMKEFSFATIITAKDNLPVATHLPFIISTADDKIILTSHFARANNQWEHVEDNAVLVIFSEPHAYISPRHYDKELNVPTWNYISVHAYGQGKIIRDSEAVFDVLKATINYYEASYQRQWDSLPGDYKSKMAKGIVAFQVEVTDLQAKMKLSQNRTDTERHKIIDALSKSDTTNEQLISSYMKNDLAKKI